MSTKERAYFQDDSISAAFRMYKNTDCHSVIRCDPERNWSTWGYCIDALDAAIERAVEMSKESHDVVGVFKSKRVQDYVNQADKPFLVFLDGKPYDVGSIREAFIKR